jgi:hypothetical protein
LEEFRAEEATCDPQVESVRCGILTALFGYGEVRQSTIWDDEYL